jgi:putative nucleotidyltransferase with HDIG domain
LTPDPSNEEPVVSPDNGPDRKSRRNVRNAVLVALLFALGFAGVLTWGRSLPRHFPGQVATRPVVNLNDYEIENRAATSEKREQARKVAPRYYLANAAYLSSLKAALDGLPVATFEKTDLESIDLKLVHRFDLTDEALDELQPFGGPKTASATWREWTDRFIGLLWAEEPIIASQEYQVFATTLNRLVLPPVPAEDPAAVAAAVAAGDGVSPEAAVEAGGGTRDRPATPPSFEPQPVRVDLALELPPATGPVQADFRRSIRRLAMEAGFPDALSDSIAGAVANDPQATVSFDETRTIKAAERAAAAVRPVLELHPRGEVIATPGEILSTEQIERIDFADRIDGEARSGWSRLTDALGAFGLAATGIGLLFAYALGFVPQLAERPQRLASLLGLMLATAAASFWISSRYPVVMPLALQAAPLLVALIAVLAYDRRLAIFAAGIQCLLLVTGLGLDAAWTIASFLACGVLAVRLNEIRQRAALVGATTLAAIAAAVGFLAAGAIETPLPGPGIDQVLRGAFLAVVACYGVSFLVLGILPTIERLFGITTALTLAELRDPREPLLRLLQQRAPGTYTHSLQVASLAEAAAESIGADGLLAYAGALYHDVGKTRKPEYFVENQQGEASRHESLSPSMSHLVIVGHVKDGLELAREHHLPRCLLHFIESHHGTTLVEYFFRRARDEAAKGGHADDIDETDFRYPGPKPRTREAGILMLADACESAVRSIADPTPERIETLVHGLVKARLDDGQLDECPLTVAELRAVEHSLVRNLGSMHHSRVAYPSSTVMLAGGPSRA